VWGSFVRTRVPPESLPETQTAVTGAGRVTAESTGCARFELRSAPDSQNGCRPCLDHLFGDAAEDHLLCSPLGARAHDEEVGADLLGVVGDDPRRVAELDGDGRLDTLGGVPLDESLGCGRALALATVELLLVASGASPLESSTTDNTYTVAS